MRSLLCKLPPHTPYSRRIGSEPGSASAWRTKQQKKGASCRASGSWKWWKCRANDCKLDVTVRTQGTRLLATKRGVRGVREGVHANATELENTKQIWHWLMAPESISSIALMFCPVGFVALNWSDEEMRLWNANEAPRPREKQKAQGPQTSVKTRAISLSKGLLLRAAWLQLAHY